MFGLLREKASIVLLIVSLHFRQRKKDKGFAVLFGIPVVTCIDGVFLFVLVSCVCVPLYLFDLL